MILKDNNIFSESTLYWIVGFIDGEGCFHISFNLSNKMPCGIEVRPSFSVSQKANSLHAITNIKNYFNCGGIRFDKKDGTYKYEVRSLKDLRQIIIPFFSRYELFTKKKLDFEIFKKACILIAEGQHLNPKGLSQIINLAYSMNGCGKRKYTEEMLLKIIGELKI